MKIVQTVLQGTKLPHDKIPSDSPPILKQITASCTALNPDDRPSFEKLASDISMYV